MNKPTLEALKEVARWLAAGAIAWFLSETITQIALVPEYSVVNVWVFTYLIPVRALIQFALTLAGRAVDKYLFIKSKEDPKRLESEPPVGLIPW